MVSTSAPGEPISAEINGHPMLTNELEMQMHNEMDQEKARVRGKTKVGELSELAQDVEIVESAQTKP